MKGAKPIWNIFRICSHISSTFPDQKKNQKKACQKNKKKRLSPAKKKRTGRLTKPCQKNKEKDQKIYQKRGQKKLQEKRGKKYAQENRLKIGHLVKIAVHSF